jgi:leucine dehydrogenase
MSQRKKYFNHDVLMRYARRLGTQEIHTLLDKETGFQAIIALHSTKLGSAIGGCRFYPYQSQSHAVEDVLRLSFMMTLKAAVSDLPHGGAKAVIIQPPEIKDREALFRAFGNFVHQLDGRYITAMDMGTTTDDMDTIAKQTPHVIGHTVKNTDESSPSPFTANGVFRGLQAAVKHKLNRDSLEGLRVSVQGLGSVASGLCHQLIKHGAIVTGCDISSENAQRAADAMGVKVVSCESIYDVPADVFSPCAIGGTINIDTIKRLDAKIIAGAANNQLSHSSYSKILQDKGVLYAPDFVLNAGGLIQAACLHDYDDIKFANQLIDRIYDRMLAIYERSDATNTSTIEVAEQIAYEKLDNHEQVVVKEIA